MNRIKQLRHEYGMSQIRLGIELGVTQETVSAYESERHYPSFAALQKMSVLMHASIDYIMGLSDIRWPTTISEISESELAFLYLYRSLSARQREKVYAYIKGLQDAQEK